MVTVSPVVMPGTDIVGVLSDVLLSALLEPESLDETRSGALGVAGDVESIVIGNTPLATESTPAMLVMTADVSHVPSATTGSVHEFVATDFTYEHDTVVPPRVALIVTVSPLAAPLADMVGVVSDVRLSELLTPRSLAVSKSGAVGALGAAVLTVIGSALEAGDVFPAGSVAVDDTCQVPPLSTGKSHEFVDTEAVNVHVTVVVPSVADTVIRSPFVAPGTTIVGVLSLVMLSLFDEPVSLASARSGVAGAEGAVRSRVIDNALDADDVCD